MDYKVEDVSPVKKKISIEVSPEEVNAAIKAALFTYQSKVELDGFRKGKAPSAVIEKRFKNEIYEEAHDDLINVHINEVIQKLNTHPVSPVTMTGEDRPLVKGQPYRYEMEFEIMPEFELPVYEGLEVEQTRPKPSKILANELIEKIRKEKGQLVPVEGEGPAKDGQIVNLDFGLYENGKELGHLSTANFELELGAGEALPEFEALIKETPVGHTAEKEIEFPPDFISEEIAGKKILIKATVHAIKEKKLPEVNDNLAISVGKKSLEDLYASLDNAYIVGMTHLYEAEAQRELLDKLIEQTDFPLPPSMLEFETAFLAMDQLERLARQGKRAFTTEEEEKKFVESFKSAGEARTREKILLLTIAKKENLEVEPKELEQAILEGARKMGENPQKYYQDLQENGLIFQLHDNLLADKAMDLVYKRANVHMKDEEPPVSESSAQDAKENSGDVSQTATEQE